MVSFTDTYEIKSVLGKGGMSTVYLAEHKRLHTFWAVKEVKRNQVTRFDFLAESNILKRLRHPMLPRIVDIFEDTEHIRIVEDYVEGISLDDLLKQEKKINEAQALQWFRDLCDVLIYLHGQKPFPIIYRDMKPSNIMLQPDGSLKLIDFGIAREYKESSGADTTYIGTRGYAAPEQFGTAQTDARADIYSLGVTMYHLVTGKSPYDPPYGFVPVRQLDPKLSLGLEHILGQCTQAEPSDRYQNVHELEDDLEHIYRFDLAWKKVRRINRTRVVIVAFLFFLSFGLMGIGHLQLGVEKDDLYQALLHSASEQYISDFSSSINLLDSARDLYPNRPEPDRQQTYALYLNEKWQECIDFGLKTLNEYGNDSQTRLIVASAQFQLGEYEEAGENFRLGGEVENLSSNYKRDYAVCLGRLGQVDEADQVLELLRKSGATDDVTAYVSGEVSAAKGDYVAAESNFKDSLSTTKDDLLIRRCYLGLGSVYRECTALARTGGSPIPNPATKSVEVLSQGIMINSLRYDSSFWELLAMAYFESYHTDTSVPQEYLKRASECFTRVIELGVTKDYLYSNLYTIYYEMEEYDHAEKVLEDFESMFPDSYLPHAFRGMLLITIENEKDQDSRDYSKAVDEYEVAGGMIRDSDDTTYYQQLGTLIENLKSNGWI